MANGKNKKRAPRVLKETTQIQSWNNLVVLHAVDYDKVVPDAKRRLSARLLGKGQKLMRAGQADRGAEALLQAHVENPRETEISIALAHLFAQQGAAQEAIFVFEKLVEQTAGNLDSRMLTSIGQLAERLAMPAAAEHIYSLLLQVEPNHHRGYCHLSNVMREQGKYAEAIDLLQFAIDKDQTSPQLWHSLAIVVAEQRGLEVAEPFYQEAIRIKPDYGAAHSNLGMALCAEGRFEDALPHLDTAMNLVSADPNARFSYATALLGAGRLAEGIENYEWRLDSGRADSVAFTHGLPRWDGGDLSDKTVLVCDEQGIGDAMMFSSCFNQVIEKAAHCYIECDYRLVDLYQRSFPAATVNRHVTYKVNGRVHRHYAWLEGQEKQPDVATEAGTLLRYLRPTIASFERPSGYLRPDPERVQFWKARFDALGPGLKVGLCWSGGYVTPVRKRNYVTLKDMASFFDIDGIHFINIMYTNTKADIDQAREELGVTIHDWPDIDRKEQIDEAFAYTAPLDYVVSVTSSPGAIAGVLGIPTADIQRARTKWMLGMPDRKPWFPNTQVFLPPDISQWPEEPIGRVAEELRQRASIKAAA
jgi:tetratricopeptide (TPR) repeat protein